MIECIFTLDYEIYGNGSGDLATLVLEPTERLLTLFRSRGHRFVVFVEAAELAAIEAAGSDAAISSVTDQVRRAYDEGFEIALHLHPQWCNAAWRNGRWQLDYSEYNLCALGRARMVEIVDRAIEYLRRTVADPPTYPRRFARAIGCSNPPRHWHACWRTVASRSTRRSTRAGCSAS